MILGATRAEPKTCPSPRLRDSRCGIPNFQRPTRPGFVQWACSVDPPVDLFQGWWRAGIDTRGWSLEVRVSSRGFIFKVLCEGLEERALFVGCWCGALASPFLIYQSTMGRSFLIEHYPTEKFCATFLILLGPPSHGQWFPCSL